MNCCMPLQYVDLPTPGGPTTSCAKGISLKEAKVTEMNLARTEWYGEYVEELQDTARTKGGDAWQNFSHRQAQ